MRLRPNLPHHQFLRAVQSGCELRVRYLQGGFVLRSGTFLLVQTKGKWRLRDVD